jgi:uncharacterized protein involved in exopolysaccharide biosynthesis
MSIQAYDPGNDPAPLGEFLAHMHVRRRVARRIFVVVFGSALLLSAVYPAQYRASASIAVMPSPEFTVREDAGSHAFSSNSLAFDQIMEAETAILQSDDLHEATIRDFGDGPSGTKQQAGRMLGGLYPDLVPDVNPNPVSKAIHACLRLILYPWRGTSGTDGPMDAALRRFARALRVLPTKDGNVITVDFLYPEANTAARALNILLSYYAERRRHIYNDPQLAVAQRETEVRADAVRDADRVLQQFKSQSGFSDYDAERELLLKRRSQAAQSSSDAHALQAQAQARLTVLDQEIATLPVAAPLFQEHDTDTRMQTLDDSLVDLRGRIVAARVHYREGSHLLTSLESQVRERETERTRAANMPDPSVLRAGRNPELDPLRLARAQALADREAARAQVDSIQQDTLAISMALHGLDANEGKLADLTRRKEAAQDAYASSSRAASEQKLIEAEDARRLANVRIIQSARVPQHQTATKLLICLAGLIFSLLTSLGWLVWKFVSQSTFLTAAGLEHATGFPVLQIFEMEPSVSNW